MKHIQLLELVQKIYLRVICVLVNNLYIWRLIYNDSYRQKNWLDIVKYTIIAAICCSGLWIATTDISKRYKKLTTALILPSFIITPFFVTMENFFLTFIVIIGGILSLFKIFKGK